LAKQKLLAHQWWLSHYAFQQPMTSTPIIRDPIYQQLNDRLRALATGGKFKAGEKFLTERQVSERFQVSRVTANKALSNLVVTGLLEFRKGVGTFLRGEALQNDLRSLVSFTRKATLSGMKPTTKVLSFSKLRAAAAPEGIAEALRVEDEEPLLFLERLRLANDEPVILERRHLVARLCPGLTRERVKGSLYDVLENDLSAGPTGAEQIIRAVCLSTAEAKLLGTRPAAAALWVHAVGFTGDKPLWVEDTLYRGDRYEFQNVLGANTPARPATPTLSDAPRRTVIKK